MTFVPKFSAVFEDFLIDNLLIVIERDFKECLDLFYPDEDYPDFAERAIGMEIGNEFPMMVLAPRYNPVESVDDGSHLVEAAKFDFHIGVIGDSFSDVTRKIMRYTRCGDCVTRTATKADWFKDMDTSKVFGLIVDVERTYGPFGENKNVMFRSATLTITVQVREM
jgi:hypothetical protein